MKDKNYYELLEIDKNASKEVIEKVYKVLVKKYHPDLQEGDNKIKSEEMIKKINNAYSVLSDETKRKQYDTTIQEDTISKKEYDRLQQELNDIIKVNLNTQQINNDNHNISEIRQNIQNYKEDEYRQKIENAVKKAYHDAYVQDLKNRGYKIRYKKTVKDYLRICMVIVVMILICVLLWIIPFTKEKLIDIYNTNPIAKGVVDIIINIFK